MNIFAFVFYAFVGGFLFKLGWLIAEAIWSAGLLSSIICSIRSKMIKKLAITVDFAKPHIGEVTFFNVEEITDLLGSGEFTFAGKYMMDDETGALTLMELAVIPISRQSTLDLRDSKNWDGHG